MESPKEKKNTSSKPDPVQSGKPFMRFYALAFELAVLNLAFILGGYYLDDYLSTSPVAILAGTFFAMTGTIWLLLKSLE